MLSKWTISLLIYFTAMGLRPELPKFSLQRKISRLVHILYVCLAIVLTYYCFEIVKWLSATATKVEVINGMIQYFLGLLTYYIFIFEVFIQRKNQKRFWLLLQNVNQQHSFAQKNVIVMHSYFAKIVEYYLAFASLMYYFVHFRLSKFSLIWLAYNLLYFITLNQIFYCLFYMDLLLFKLKSIENSVKRMSESLNKYKYSSKFFGKFTSFIWIRECYRLINEMNDCIQSNFGCSISAIIPYIFIVLLSQINWSYRSASNVRAAIGRFI